MSAIDHLVQGAIHFHVHFGPDARVERRYSALETVKKGAELGIGGMVLKSHEYPTVPLAQNLMLAVPQMKLWGGICMNYEVGGMNPPAAEASARMGAKMLWMPTFSCTGGAARKGLGPGIPVVDDSGRILNEVGEVLEVVRANEMVLNTGHLWVHEVMPLVDEAVSMGISRIVITHVSSMSEESGIRVQEMKALADKGAFLEHSILATMPMGTRLDPRDLAGIIREVGPERCILSTDLGQAHNPHPAEGLRLAIATMLMCGLEESDVECMVKTNPATILD